MLVKSPTNLVIFFALVILGLFVWLSTLFFLQPSTNSATPSSLSSNEHLLPQIQPIANHLEQQLQFVTPEGQVVKTFSLQELGQSPTDTLLRFIKLSNKHFWFQAQLAQQITAIITIDPTDWSVETFDVESQNILACDFALEASSRKFIYGDFCPLDTLDVDDADAANRPHILYTYDLATNKKQALITLYSYEPFAPVWINATTVEYTNPDKTERQVTSL